MAGGLNWAEVFFFLSYSVAMLIGDRGFLIDLIHCEIDKHHYMKNYCAKNVLFTTNRWNSFGLFGPPTLNRERLEGKNGAQQLVLKMQFSTIFFRVNHKYSKLSENSLQTYFFYFHRKTQTITETASILSDLFAFPSKKNNFMADLFFEKYLFFDLETLEIN